jgi:hypothetical protein
MHSIEGRKHVFAHLGAEIWTTEQLLPKSQAKFQR